MIGGMHDSGRDQRRPELDALGLLSHQGEQWPRRPEHQVIDDVNLVETVVLYLAGEPRIIVHRQDSGQVDAELDAHGQVSSRPGRPH